jgi:hypothetical protein
LQDIYRPFKFKFIKGVSIYTLFTPYAEWRILEHRENLRNLWTTPDAWAGEEIAASAEGLNGRLNNDLLSGSKGDNAVMHRESRFTFVLNGVELGESEISV